MNSDLRLGLLFDAQVDHTKLDSSEFNRCCDIRDCQSLPGGWNTPADDVHPVTGEQLDQPAWEYAMNCSARRNESCGFKPAYNMGSYRVGKDEITGEHYGQVIQYNTKRNKDLDI